MKKSRNLSGIKTTLFLILMLGCRLSANAGIVKGTIKDKQNNEPLVGATVIVTENSKGATADIAGNYKLELSAGIYTMTIRYIRV